MNGLVNSDVRSGKCGLKQAQTYTEQGLLRNLDTWAEPCNDHEFSLSSLQRDNINVNTSLHSKEHLQLITASF
jgi:hypothetical protein